MTLNWLTYFPSPARGVWHLGPIPIRAYALCIIVGIVAALLIGDRRWRARGGEPGVIYDIALWAVPFGLIGGRFYHLMTDWQTYFGAGGVGWEATPRIWDGGLGIWGAVALGGIGAWIGCRRRGIPLPAFGDAIAPGIVLAQAIGRIGNYFNQELYGRETTLPWGLEIYWREDAAGIRDPHLLDGVSTGELYKIVQPTFLYELLWNLAVFAVLIFADRRFRLGHGRLFALYVAGYCIGRFGIELLRDDAATHLAGIRVNSFTSTFVFIGAVVYILLARRGREDPEVLRRAWQPDEAGLPPAEGTDSEPDAEPEAGKDLVTVGAANGVGSVVRVPERLSGQAESFESDVAEDDAQDTEDADEAESTEGTEETEATHETEDTESTDDADVGADLEDEDTEDTEAVEEDSEHPEDSEGTVEEHLDSVEDVADEDAADESDDEAPEPETERAEPVDVDDDADESDEVDESDGVDEDDIDEIESEAKESAEPEPESDEDTEDDTEPESDEVAEDTEDDAEPELDEDTDAGEDDDEADEPDSTDDAELH